MYNRYIRADNGVYTRIPQQDEQRESPAPKTPPERQEKPKIERKPEPADRMTDGITDVLRGLLDRFHLNHVDTGDLMLLALLFLLFHEDADEEVLIALGLLLIKRGQSLCFALLNHIKTVPSGRVKSLAAGSEKSTSKAPMR